MPTMRGELAMVDTNVLLAATNTAHRNHAASRRFFPEALGQGVHLATCGQILREYLVVATRPTVVNGLGLSPDDALHNLAWFRKRMVFFEESELVHHELIKLVTMGGISGKQIHDANIAAIMRCTDIRYLATYNAVDFTGMPGFECFEPGDPGWFLEACG
jgi:predicted nucleic acid-binding protein